MKMLRESGYTKSAEIFFGEAGNFKLNNTQFKMLAMVFVDKSDREITNTLHISDRRVEYFLSRLRQDRLGGKTVRSFCGKFAEGVTYE